MGSLPRPIWGGERPQIHLKLALDVDYNISQEFRGDPLSEFASEISEKVRRRIFLKIRFIRDLQLSMWGAKRPLIPITVAQHVGIDIWLEIGGDPLSDFGFKRNEKAGRRI